MRVLRRALILVTFIPVAIVFTALVFAAYPLGAFADWMTDNWD